jgi:CheY-like chemotaxis protein
MTAAQQRRVLVVDDDAVTRELLLFALRRRALTVDEARDGHEALALMKDHQYAVIVLDLLMPGLDGAGVLEGMGKPDLTSPPVVLVITAADRREIARLDPRRIHGIMRKPFDPEELAEVVAACAEIRSRNAFGTMAIATMIAGSPFLALLNRFQG